MDNTDFNMQVEVAKTDVEGASNDEKDIPVDLEEIDNSSYLHP